MTTDTVPALADVVPAYTIFRSQRPDGADAATATYGGREFSVITRHGATMAPARQLVAAGASDARWVVRSPDGKRRLHGGSPHHLAALTVRETERGARAFVAFIRNELHE